MSEKRNKRKLPWLLGVFVFLLLLVLVVLQSSNMWKSVSIQTSTDTLFLYALSTLNFVALIVFASILTRSLLKLRQERKAFQLGSKLKTKLLIYFAAVSLLPLIAMAIFSYLFMNRALDKWFSQLPENVVRQAGKLQNESAQNQKNKANDSARIVAYLLNEVGTEQTTLDKMREEGNLSGIEILDRENRILRSSRSKLDPELSNEYKQILEVASRGDFSDPGLSDGNGLDAYLAILKSGEKLLIVPAGGSEGTVSEVLNNSLVEFDNLKASQVFVRRLGLTTLGLLTFLLIFASSWAAFYVAKGLTRPIRALAEGADEIAQGNFSHRVDVLAEDELELLVAAFNAMIEKLEHNDAELKERRYYIETILQSLSTGVISFDSESHVTTINKAAISMLKLEDADFVGFGLTQLVAEDNRKVFERLINRAKRIGHASEQTTLREERTDGSSAAGEEMYVALTASALANQNGTVVVIEDLTELISAQRASAWQEVARRMAHEIKNPLTPIQLSAERIAKRFSSGDNGAATSAEVVTEGTETILREVASLKSMVDEFSRFARLPDAELDETDISEVISKTVSLYDGRTGATSIVTKCTESIPLIMGDPEQLKRVFVNLIDNALESFESEQEINSIQINTIYDAGREVVRVEIVDNGSGIDQSDIQKLFQPYFSTKGRGTGLGLAIVHRIIREHNGRIAASTVKPNGSKFTIELPVLT